MDLKSKFELEFPIQASPHMLYQYISSASGLSEWFADNVNSRGEIFSFFWDGAEEKAKLISSKSNLFVKYRWLDESDDQDKCFFEIRIVVDEITKATKLRFEKVFLSDNQPVDSDYKLKIKGYDFSIDATATPSNGNNLILETEINLIIKIQGSNDKNKKFKKNIIYSNKQVSNIIVEGADFVPCSTISYTLDGLVGWAVNDVVKKYRVYLNGN